jgi:hypothetical protein
MPNLTDTRWIVEDLLDGLTSVVVTANVSGMTTDENDPDLGVFPGMGYANEVVDDAPVAYWRLGESPLVSNGAGTVFADETGVHPGTYNNVYGYYTALTIPGVLKGDPNRAWSMENNYYSYIAVPRLGVGDVPLEVGDAFTLEAWVRPSYDSYMTVMTGMAGPMPAMQIVQRVLKLSNASATRFIASAIPTSEVPADQWSHCVITKDGTDVHLYVNGVDVTDVDSVSNYTFVNSDAIDPQPCNDTFDSDISGWQQASWVGYTGNTATISWQAADGYPGLGCLAAAFTGRGQDAAFRRPLTTTLYAGITYTLQFAVKSVGGSGSLSWGFGSIANTGLRATALNYSISTSWVYRSLTFTPTYDVVDPAVWIAGYGSITQTIEVDQVTVSATVDGSWRLGGARSNNYWLAGGWDEFAIYDYALTPERVALHYDLGITGNPGIRTAWGGAEIRSPGRLTVSTTGSDYVPATYVWRVTDPLLGTLEAVRSVTDGSDINAFLESGSYLIEMSQMDPGDGTSLVLTLTLQRISQISMGMLLRGVGAAQFTWARLFDLGGIGVLSWSRPFDIETTPLVVRWRRPFDIAGGVGLAWSRPFDLGEGGARWFWSRPFDLIDDNGQDPGGGVVIPPQPVPINAVQRIHLVGSVGGGSFILTFAGQSTANIQYNATAATIQSALEALSNVDPGDIVVTGGPLYLGHPVTLTFGGQYAGVDVPLVVITTYFVGFVTAVAGITESFTVDIWGATGRREASHTDEVTGTTEAEFNVIVPASGSTIIDIEIPVASLLSYWIFSDKDLTMTENDDGSPDLTVALAAGSPWYWPGYGAQPFVVDVVTLKFTNAGASDALVKGGFLMED